MDFSKLTKYLDDLEKDYGVPGYDLIVKKDHETIFRRMGGFSDYDRSVPVAESDLYIMYSATKVITMTAAMQLIEQGKIGLDDPVTKYLPEFAKMEVADHCVLNQWPPQIPTLADPHHPAKTPITLRMLMTMTAGLNYDIGNAEIVKVREETGLSAGAIALAYLTSQPFPTFPLVGASRVEHVEALREAGDALLTDRQRDLLRSFSR